MFLTFFYLLRASGINVSLSEWLTLMEGLRLDLHDSTLSGFYTLCRSVLLHSGASAYVVVGIAAFVTGCIVTALCLYLKKRRSKRD